MLRLNKQTRVLQPIITISTTQSLMRNNVSLSIFRPRPSLAGTTPANMGFLEPIQQLIYATMGYVQSRTYKSTISQSANAGHS